MTFKYFAAECPKERWQRLNDSPSTAFCVVHYCIVEAGGSEETQETRFTNNTGAVQVSQEKTILVIHNRRKTRYRSIVPVSEQLPTQLSVLNYL